jgi:hypothetical protein
VNSRSVRMKAALDLLLLSSIGDAPRMVDEIRIGSTWRSVVPIKFVKDLPTAKSLPRHPAPASAIASAPP